MQSWRLNHKVYSGRFIIEIVAKDKWPGYLLRAGAIFVAYFVSARLGLGLDAVSGFATVVWPPTGMALAAIFILGYRYWPAIMLAAFLVNFVTGAPALVALGISIGNVGEALVGAYILKRFVQFQRSMERLRDVMGLVLFAAPLSTALSATVGTTSLLAGSVIHSSAYGATWGAWWIGDMLGDLVVAPLLIIWSVRYLPALGRRRLIEITLLVIILLGTSTTVFSGLLGFGEKPYTFAYLIFPILIWTALRFGQRGSVAAIFTLSTIAVWCTYVNFSTSANHALGHNLLLLQSFMGISAVTFMVMAAIVSERERTQKHQQQLTQRTLALTKQRLRLLALNKAKDEFVAIASHQLRTPATAVKQYVGILLDGYSGSIAKEQRIFLEKAYENNERQLHIVNDILQVAKLDLGKVRLNLKLHDIGKILDKSAGAMRSQINNKNQSLHLIKPEKRVQSIVDNEHLRLVLENLIENASNYSPDGSEITVRLYRPRAKKLEISIEDEGVGINSMDLRHLFKKISRINNSFSNNVNGSGLGLYFSKKIIDLHKGTIKVSASPRRGSIFTISLPYKTQTGTHAKSSK